MAETEPLAQSSRRGSGGRRVSGPDRLTVWLLTAASFLAVLAVLAGELRASDRPTAQRPVVVLRRVYETRVIESVPASQPVGGGGTSVTQSVSGSGSAAGAPVSTRTSGA